MHILSILYTADTIGYGFCVEEHTPWTALAQVFDLVRKELSVLEEGDMSREIRRMLRPSYNAPGSDSIAWVISSFSIIYIVPLLPSVFLQRVRWIYGDDAVYGMLLENQYFML